MSFSLVGERLEGEKRVAERGERRLEVTAEKHLVGDAFNVRQRAVVVVIGASSTSSLFNVVPAVQDALNEITDEKRRP